MWWTCPTQAQNHTSCIHAQFRGLQQWFHVNMCLLGTCCVTGAVVVIIASQPSDFSSCFITFIWSCEMTPRGHFFLGDSHKLMPLCCNSQSHGLHLRIPGVDMPSCRDMIFQPSDFMRHSYCGLWWGRGTWTCPTQAPFRSKCMHLQSTVFWGFVVVGTMFVWWGIRSNISFSAMIFL